jgi:hypothetical protein
MKLPFDGLTVKAFAEQAGVCPATVRIWMNLSVIPYWKLRNCVRIPRDEAMAALASYYRKAKHQDSEFNEPVAA